MTGNCELISMRSLNLSLFLLLLTPVYSAPTSPITFGIDLDAVLERSSPTFQWGMLDDANNYYPNDGYGDRPQEWVNSMFGANGDLGYMLYSPTKNTLRLDVSKLTLWDDRTPDMDDYVNDYVLDQPRMGSGYFEITWWGNSSSDLPRKVS